MQVKKYTPHPALQPYVLTISTISATLPFGTDEVITPYPPTPFQSLIFYCRDAIAMGKADTQDFKKQPLSILIGPQFSRVDIKVFNQIRAIRVDFLPGGMHRMLGLPMSELFDAGFDVCDFFNEVKRINEQLQNTSSLEIGKNIVEQFLLKKISNAKSILPFDFAIQTLLKNNGALPIEQTASLACLSLKQFERKCQERIGMSPKTYARILRFSKAYRLHEAFPQLSWTKIAYEANYFDQMHMIRDFKVFAGVNPSVIERQLHQTPLRMQKDITY